jgi:hypothetical protein
MINLVQSGIARDLQFQNRTCARKRADQEGVWAQIDIPFSSLNNIGTRFTDRHEGMEENSES